MGSIFFFWRILPAGCVYYYRQISLITIVKSNKLNKFQNLYLKRHFYPNWILYKTECKWHEKTAIDWRSICIWMNFKSMRKTLCFPTKQNKTKNTFEFKRSLIKCDQNKSSDQWNRNIDKWENKRFIRCMCVCVANRLNTFERCALNAFRCFFCIYLFFIFVAIKTFHIEVTNTTEPSQTMLVIFFLGKYIKLVWLFRSQNYHKNLWNLFNCVHRFFYFFVVCLFRLVFLIIFWFAFYYLNFQPELLKSSQKSLSWSR